jgi:hypothetical protein
MRVMVVVQSGTLLRALRVLLKRGVQPAEEGTTAKSPLLCDMQQGI